MTSAWSDGSMSWQVYLNLSVVHTISSINDISVENTLNVAILMFELFVGNSDNAGELQEAVCHSAPSESYWNHWIGVKFVVGVYFREHLIVRNLAEDSQNCPRKFVNRGKTARYEGSQTVHLICQTQRREHQTKSQDIERPNPGLVECSLHTRIQRIWDDNSTYPC